MSDSSRTTASTVNITKKQGIEIVYDSLSHQSLSVSVHKSILSSRTYKRLRFC